MSVDQLELPKSIKTSPELINWSLENEVLTPLPRLPISYPKRGSWRRVVLLGDENKAAHIEAAGKKLTVSLRSYHRRDRLAFLAYQTPDREGSGQDPKLAFSIFRNLINEPDRDDPRVRADFNLGKPPKWIELYLPYDPVDFSPLRLEHLDGKVSADSVYESVLARNAHELDWVKFLKNHPSTLSVSFKNAVLLGLQDLPRSK